MLSNKVEEIQKEDIKNPSTGAGMNICAAIGIIISSAYLVNKKTK